MSPLQAGSLGAVGKLRARADFVHLRSHHPSFSVFEAWMAHSAEWAASRGGSAWPEAFREGGTQAFVFRTVTSGRDSAWLAGAMAPSSDQAGRLFPLAVALPLSAPAEVRAQPALLPLLLEPCWRTASELVSAALADPQYPLTEQLAGREALRQLDTVEAVSSLDEWIREATLTELWSLISAGGQLPNIPEALGWLSAVIRPVRGMEASDTPLSLRLPLGAAGGAAVCFWLA
ncbi:MAG TPA: type VI secretion system-associated protein TagF, partial [Polyangiaceae bacterium]|nr:type VI secretion system-associated protein TagF [Polyangiaceae bacterium]